MDLKKLAPWNWFKKEEEAEKILPVVTRARERGDFSISGTLADLHQEIDRMFDRVFKGWAPSFFDRPFFSRVSEGLFKPTLDLGATEQEYTISVELPGVDEKDVKVEIADDTLTIRGEKRQEKEEKDKNFYRVERSYGSFQRVLSLPEDADQDNVKAVFKKGVLTVTLPRKALPRPEAKQIPVKTEE